MYAFEMIKVTAQEVLTLLLHGKVSFQHGLDLICGKREHRLNWGHRLSGYVLCPEDVVLLDCLSHKVKKTFE